MKEVFIIKDLSDDTYKAENGWVVMINEAKQYWTYDDAKNDINTDYCQVIKISMS